jgi:hypothetical protein
LYREKHGICRSSSRRRHGHSGIIISRGRSLDPETTALRIWERLGPSLWFGAQKLVPELQLLTRKINIADTAMLITIEPKQPNRFEKKKNT